MFHTVLAAVDGSASSLKAAEVAVKLAAVCSATLDILSVEETPPRYVATSEESAQEHSATLAYYDRLHAPLVEFARSRGVQARCAVISGHEGQAILDYVRDHHCDLLVIGHQGHSGVWGTSLGSTADKLVSHTVSSLLVGRTTMGNILYRRLLVALDGSPLSWQAFKIGVQMARELGASLRIVSVVEGPRTPPAEQTPSPVERGGAPPSWDWKAYLQQTHMLAIAQAAMAGASLETDVREGHASSVLTEVAREEGCDLLILGATGQEHPWSATTGGTARRVANEAPCAVLLVRPPITQQRVRDVMSIEAAWVSPDTSLAEITSRLIEQGVKLLTVVNEQRQVLGVITLGSLLAQDEIYRHLDLQQATDADHFLEHLRQFFTAEKQASDIMIPHPIVVKDDVGIEQAVRWMLAQRVTRMPVVNAERKLVGLLDQENILRYYTGLAQAPEMPDERKKARPAALPRTVGEIPLTQVPLIAQETPLTEVLHTIERTPLRRVIVLKPDSTALGVIADRDLLAARGLMARRNPLLSFAGRFSLRFPEELFRRRPSSGLLAAQQVMKPHLFSATPSTPVAEALRLMVTHRIKRLVVIDEAGKPLGLVDRQQLLRALIEGEAASG